MTYCSSTHNATGSAPVRKFLVWCSAKNGKHAAELYADHRLFDVAIHDYGPWGDTKKTMQEYNYWIPSEGTEKFETAGANMPALMNLGYEAFAFIDDDLPFTTAELNCLFVAGMAWNLQLYQPALTKDSACSHPHLMEMVDRYPYYRRVPFVEVMCPFFSRAALEKCLWSFELNQSGWGLDCYIWPKLVEAHVLDSITIKHPGPFRPAALRQMRNGLNAWQELDIVRKINYDGPSPW